MKRTLLLGLALTLFSCSNEDQATSGLDANKEVQTIDPYTGYASPYDYSPGGAQSADFSYVFTNRTSYRLSFEAYFGLGAYDGVSNSEFWGLNLFDEEIIIYDEFGEPKDTIPNIYYSPNLTLNGSQYGNYIKAERMELLPRSVSEYQGMGFAVPFYDPMSSTSNPGFTFNYPGSIYRNMERDIISKSGKLFFIVFKVYDGNNTIASSVVRMKAPRDENFVVSDSLNNWKLVGKDSFFNERMFYHKDSREIVIPITSKSTYEDLYRFRDSGGVSYEVGIRTTNNRVEIYLN